MNFRKLLTYLAVGTAAVIPFAGAQNPTILQGNYISNVFGQSNFILNPNAQTNTANVTVSSATVTRSTTTPLVATSEFNITTSTATGYADWATRTFDAGMKNQNCEARFTYRGFSVGSTTVQIRQGSNTVAQLTLTASTDPRIASINFPCGDLSSATTLRVQQATASLTGTNELSGLYLGLATNQANVAQAELVGGLTTSSLNSVASGSLTSFTNLTYQTGSVAAFGKATSASNTLSVTFDSLPAGEYMVVMNQPLFMYGGTGGHSCRFRIYEDTSTNSQLIAEAGSLGAAANQYVAIQANMPARFSFTTTASRTFRVQVNNNGWTASANGTCYTESSFNGGIFVYRFPTSSELVVTPERQNTYGGVKYVNSNQSIRNTSAPSSTYFEFNNATWNQPTLLIGKAAVTTTGSGNDLGFSMPNLPVGQYKVSIRGLINASTENATTLGQVSMCSFKIRETTIGTDVALQVHRDTVSSTTPTSSRDYEMSFFGVLNNTSVGTRNFRLEAAKVTDNTTGSVGTCQAYSASASERTEIVFLLEPLDQPSNSALYVEGPVKAAATGAAIPAGYVGELKEAEATGITVTTSATTITSLTLQPGIWLLNFNAQADTTLTIAFECGVATATNSTTGWNVRKNYAVQTGTSASYPYALLSNYYVAVTTATTYYLTCKLSPSGTTVASGKFHAIRLN